jgi:hypothetical protein
MFPLSFFIRATQRIATTISLIAYGRGEEKEKEEEDLEKSSPAVTTNE